MFKEHILNDFKHFIFAVVHFTITFVEFWKMLKNNVYPVVVCMSHKLNVCITLFVNCVFQVFYVLTDSPPPASPMSYFERFCQCLFFVFKTPVIGYVKN